MPERATTGRHRPESPHAADSQFRQRIEETARKLKWRRTCRAGRATSISGQAQDALISRSTRSPDPLHAFVRQMDVLGSYSYSASRYSRGSSIRSSNTTSGSLDQSKNRFLALSLCFPFSAAMFKGTDCAARCHWSRAGRRGSERAFAIG